jgi:hypothetical protein
MKANLATITNQNELAHWRNNVDLWQTMVDQMEQVQKHMESMGAGMMQGHGKTAPLPCLPPETKPE